MCIYILICYNIYSLCDTNSIDRLHCFYNHCYIKCSQKSLDLTNFPLLKIRI